MPNKKKEAEAYVHVMPLYLGRTSFVRIAPKHCEAATAVATIDGQNLLKDDEQLDATALSVLTVAHEAAHIKHDSADEAATQCRAYQYMGAVAEALGASSSVADRLTQYAAPAK